MWKPAKGESAGWESLGGTKEQALLLELAVNEGAKGQERQPRESECCVEDPGPGLRSLRTTPRESAGCGDTGPGACGCSGATGRVTAAAPPLTAHVAAPGALSAVPPPPPPRLQPPSSTQAG